MKNILVTGGSGFIGSALCLELAKRAQLKIVNLDKLTYAANPLSLADIEDNENYAFIHGSINDAATVSRVLRDHQIDTVFHLAAESHVDRSISGPLDFMETNILGTYSLLQAIRGHLADSGGSLHSPFRLVHVSTDEVFGDLDVDSPAFSETTGYRPSSPYSASKAASDHLARAWARTYDLPVIVTNCSNNYGPRQFPEKLIPLMILNALEGKPLPVYGDGLNIRDWLFVEDHVKALALIAERGETGSTYNIGGNAERTNLQVVDAICEALEELRPSPSGTAYRDLVRFVPDRAGHDRRYAIDSSKLSRELGWQAGNSFEYGLCKTVAWYLENQSWWENVRR